MPQQPSQRPAAVRLAREAMRWDPRVDPRASTLNMASRQALQGLNGSQRTELVTEVTALVKVLAHQLDEATVRRIFEAYEADEATVRRIQEAFAASLVQVK